VLIFWGRRALGAGPPGAVRARLLLTAVVGGFAVSFVLAGQLAVAAVGSVRLGLCTAPPKIATEPSLSSVPITKVMLTFSPFGVAAAPRGGWLFVSGYQNGGARARYDETNGGYCPVWLIRWQYRAIDWRICSAGLVQT
jgi:hypothetical protein